jgi:hypothetical protein
MTLTRHPGYKIAASVARRLRPRDHERNDDPADLH